MIIVVNYYDVCHVLTKSRGYYTLVCHCCDWEIEKVGFIERFN